MVGVASLPVFFAVVTIIAVGTYFVSRRYEGPSALVAAIGAGLVGLYFFIAVTLSLM